MSDFMFDNDGETIEIECVIKRISERAVLITEIDEDDEVWIPLSQCDVSHSGHKSPRATVTMPVWLARKHGWE